MLDEELVCQALAGKSAAYEPTGPSLGAPRHRVLPCAGSAVATSPMNSPRKRFVRGYVALPTLVDPSGRAPGSAAIALRVCLDWLNLPSVP